VRSIVAAAAVALACCVPGCGGAGAGNDPQVTTAVAGLYAIDHDGASPEGNDLDPYIEAFSRVQAGCEGSADDLASAIANLSTQASNGSGTRVTSLDALHAAAETVGTTQVDCRGLFVGVEARLEGAAG
jgi:hypothetical protein